MRYCIVGAGFSGAVIGRALAQAGHEVLVIDERSHVAGNCHSQRDSETGVMTHVYGPHIFHTADERVWAYVQQFGIMRPYRHRVQAVCGGLVYSLPVNLLTINQFFRKAMGPEEAAAFVASKTRKIPEPANFEEQALSMIGPELYEAFFRGYTRKQWGLDPDPTARFDPQTPAASLQFRRFLFRPPPSGDAGARLHGTGRRHPGHAAPRVAAGRTIRGSDRALRPCGLQRPDRPLFRLQFGQARLPHPGFRGLQGERRLSGLGRHQLLRRGDVPFTRITEHKHFAPWEKDQFEGTILYREFSRACGPNDIPYYPIRQTDEEAMLKKYVDRAMATPGVTFVGRLGSYRYLDMDVTIGEALAAADGMLKRISEGAAIPTFFAQPLQGH